MVFAQIINQVCTNILEFDTEERAKSFADNIVKLEDGFGIGDNYIDNKWSKHQETTEEKIKKIDNLLTDIDKQGVTRHLENQIEASGTYETIYESTRNLIDKKRELRLQREELMSKLNEEIVVISKENNDSEITLEDEEIIAE